MSKAISQLSNSPISQALLTVIIYALYGTIIGVSLIPSAFLLQGAWHMFLTVRTPLSVPAFSIACGLALFLYFCTGTVVMGSFIRLVTLGIKPGRYPVLSLTMLRWMVYSGVYHLAGMTILAYVPMSFLGILFCKLMGAKIGKNVRLNTWFLNDAYLLEIGDNVVIGGKTDVSCHTVEGGKLILQRVKIGDNTLIGQRCYVSPGVTIGANCVIGQYAFIRKGTEIPDKSVISAIAGMPIRAVARIEREGLGGPRTRSAAGPSGDVADVKGHQSAAPNPADPSEEHDMTDGRSA
jgi:carbonic anhydrase/acetyltransferase-like protein (isoleucine patch superfamily)